MGKWVLVRVCCKVMGIRNGGGKGMLMTACAASNKLNTKVMRLRYRKRFPDGLNYVPCFIKRAKEAGNGDVIMKEVRLRHVLREVR